METPESALLMRGARRISMSRGTEVVYRVAGSRAVPSRAFHVWSCGPYSAMVQKQRGKTQLPIKPCTHSYVAFIHISFNFHNSIVRKILF